MEELIAESRKVEYHWNFLRIFISVFQIGYFIILWLATYNLILKYAGPIPYDYWLIFFGMTAIIAVGAAQALLMFLIIPMRYLVKKEGYSFMPRKYGLTDTGIYYYFKGAGYRHTYWKNITRVRFLLGSRIVRIYTKERMDLGKILNRQRNIRAPKQIDVFDILLRPKDVKLFMELYKEHLLD